MNFSFWGTYDSDKPRVRILLDGLRASGQDVQEIHANPWIRIKDKSQIRGPKTILRVVVFLLAAYPVLLVRYAFSRKHDLVVCGYPGNLDVILLWPFAKLRREPVVLDAFLPVHETVAIDRAMISSEGLFARLLHAAEQLSYRLADFVIVDTSAHGEYISTEFGVERQKIVRAFVGCESGKFMPERQALGRNIGPMPKVLFYGQFIPLHGVLTIYEAARLSIERGIRWKVIGSGQESKKFGEMLKSVPLDLLEWVQWVEYEDLVREIHAADVCLGIFGTSSKAARVIPNKVFQVIACGKPLVTRDSPAVRELFETPPAGIRLVPPGDPQAIVDAVLELVGTPATVEYDRRILDQITPERIGRSLMERLSRRNMP